MASGKLPPNLAARFTLAEAAVLAVVAVEVAKRGACDLSIGHIAALAGVCATTVRNAMREAARLGLLSVEERRLTAFRNDTNVVRINSPEWRAWLRVDGGGCKTMQRTHTDSYYSAAKRPSSASKGAADDWNRKIETTWSRRRFLRN